MDLTSLKSRARETSLSLSQQIDQSRTNLYLIGKTSNSVQHISSHEDDDANSLFLSQKNSCRVILNFLYDSVIESAHHETVISNLEASLVDFEDKYRGFISITTEEKLENILRLAVFKDKMLARLCNQLLSQASIEYQYIDSLEEYAAPDVAELMKLFGTFKLLSKAIKKLEFSREEADEALTMSSLQQQLLMHKAELARKTDDFDKLYAKYKAATMESGRQQVLLKQQESIDTLEITNKELTKELQKLRSENRRTIQNESYTKDLLDRSHMQTKNLKETFEKQISSIRPQLQDQIQGNIPRIRITKYVANGKKIIFLLERLADQKRLRLINNAVSASSDRSQMLQAKIRKMESDIQLASIERKVMLQSKKADELRIESG